MASVELTVAIHEVPDDVAASPCTAYFTFAMAYHHAMPVERWREETAHELEAMAAQVRRGEADPDLPHAEQEEHA